ncbi:hypothetical protein K32_18650 [Kaistia sp. 32K]|uniref:hypothetical protein n=1 Tax=Kaistia sp. 32K TaxID=2795690 RepID=UPI001915E85B|nr:hypothetical protein [Kaistia sp. 32K]BCP53248.1 hypothetical protein K32_18650 [Kaistia sp. 32K]
MTTLLITDGDQTADLLAAAGSRATILPWRDALHDGPLPALDTLEAFSAVRAEHLALVFKFDPGTVAATFAERDAVMRRHAEFDRIELWFEHDLYDQLQLLQVLDFFAREERSQGIVIVQADSFFALERPDTVMRFAIDGVRVSPALLNMAVTVWGELTAPTPQAIAKRAGKPIKGFPFLQAALGRFLEELPQPGTGLNRTEMRLLDAIGMDELSPAALFHQAREAEEAPFMGTWPFYAVIDSLAFCDFPLITGVHAPYSHADSEVHAEYVTAPLTLTDMGEDILSGAQDQISTNGIRRWWGGTELNGFSAWRFNRETRTLLEPR